MSIVRVSSFFFLCALFMAAASQSSAAKALSSSPFHPVFAFGDSTTDTGNQIRTRTLLQQAPAASPPYGTTYFRCPTGRYSDGRVMLDFLCSSLKLRFLPPHLAHLRDANDNFAVAGATALDLATLHDIASVTSTTPDSLQVQLSWFKQRTQGTDLSKALVYFGEIGGNDYNYALAARRPTKELALLPAAVINTVLTSLDTILRSGVKNLVVQGQFPMGCLAVYLHTLSDTQAIDANGCIRSVMEISDQHNVLLKDALAQLSKAHPDANIVFLDTSAAYLHILQNAAAYSFTNVHDACFTGGFALPNGTTTSASHDQLASVPHPDTRLCPNPQNYISWDGIHMTDAMYGAMVKLFLSTANYSSPFPNFLTACAA